MKTKSFLLFSTSVFATSIFLILFHSQQPESIQNIVTQTHQHIKDFKENLKDVEERHLVEEERYLSSVGLGEHSVELWQNTSVPVLVTYARGDGHAQAVGFVRAVSARLPHTVLLYNLGLTSHSLAIVSNYCNSSKCVILEFDLSEYPSHVSDESINAFRPLIIQHALSRVGGVIFAEPWQRWSGTADELKSAWNEVSESGVAAYARRTAVTSLTHPRMFNYFHVALDEFFFIQMLDVSRLIVSSKPTVQQMMKAWIQCALTLDCIMPIGAQSGGCKFDKKPQYRYSGCHEQDASALSIILGLKFGFNEKKYIQQAPLTMWTKRSAAEAQADYNALKRNTTDIDTTPENTPPT